MCYGAEMIGGVFAIVGTVTGALLTFFLTNVAERRKKKLRVKDAWIAARFEIEAVVSLLQTRPLGRIPPLLSVERAVADGVLGEVTDINADNLLFLRTLVHDFNDTHERFEFIALEGIGAGQDGIRKPLLAASKDRLERLSKSIVETGEALCAATKPNLP